MAANLFNRYIWLVDNIYRAGERGITLDEINRRWVRSQYNETGEKYPERSFFRHKNAIKELFDIDIECDKRTGAYAISNADDIEQGGVRSWLLNTFAVNNLINESHHLKRRILFEEIPSGQRFLTPIIEAMRDGLTVRLTYRSFNSESATTFDVQPYCVKVFKQRWYLVAYNSYYDAVRIYALDRAEAAEATGEPFRLPRDFDGKAFFADSFGVIVDDETEVERVEILVRGRQRDYLRTLPLHATQQETETTAAYSRFEFRLRPTYDFQQELLTHCLDEAVEIVSPTWLRDHFSNYGEHIRTANKGPHLPPRNEE